MSNRLDVDDIILNFDPASPQTRFQPTTMDEAAEASPRPISWPAGTAPTPARLDVPPIEADDLTQFHGYDAAGITWTAAEASALAAIFTTSYPTSIEYQYRHDVASYIPLVSGAKAPFNSNEPEMTRYRHSLGLYFPCRIGNARVLLFKSGLHLDYDGPATPVRRLVEEIATAIKPRLFVTTGTAGAIGSDIRLGDVIIAAKVRFDCKSLFEQKEWASSTFQALGLLMGHSRQSRRSSRPSARPEFQAQVARRMNQIEPTKRQAASTYMKYGALTTATSAIATWAVIQAATRV